MEMVKEYWMDDLMKVLKRFGDISIVNEVDNTRTKSGTFKVNDLVSNDWCIIDREKKMDLVLKNKAGVFILSGSINKFIRDDVAKNSSKYEFEMSLSDLKSDFVSKKDVLFDRKIIKRIGDIVLVKTKMYDSIRELYSHSTRKKDIVWVDESDGVEFIGYIPLSLRVFVLSSKHSYTNSKELEVLEVYKIVDEKNFRILVKEYWMDDDWESVQCLEGCF